MKFMMIVKATEDSEAGVKPSPELLEAMTKYNEELVKAGVLLGVKVCTQVRTGFVFRILNLEANRR